MIRKNNNIIFILTASVLFLLPFHALLSTFFRFEVGIEHFWIWKEIVLILILCFNLLDDFKRFKIFKDPLSLIVLFYAVFLLISAFWAPADSFVYRIFVGAKYDLMMFVALFAGLSFGRHYRAILKYAFFGGFFAVLTGLFLHFVIGPENLTVLGFRNDWSTFYSDQALAFCQKIENSPICRFQGTFSGPNQAGFYLMLFLPLAWYFRNSYRFFSIAGIVAGLIALFFTFSRSAWIGFFVEMAILSGFHFRSYIKYFAGPILAVLGSILVFAPRFVLRPVSTSEHFAKWADGFNFWTEKFFFGHGLGTAGPASRILTDTPMIPESWFLQTAIEGGIIALLLFSLIYFLMLRRLWSSGEILFFAILAGMLIPAQLLHAFEASAMSYSLFLILGMALRGRHDGRIL